MSKNALNSGVKPEKLRTTALQQLLKQQKLAGLSDPYFGFARVAACVIRTKIADVGWNLDRHVRMLRRLKKDKVDGAVFPELSLTAYSCGRYFQQKSVRDAARSALVKLAKATKASGYNGVICVGAPLVIDGALFNCMVAICRGKFLGVSVKRYPPGYDEFEETKVFSYGDALTSTEMKLGGQIVPVGTDLVFEAEDAEGFAFAMPICEDDWTIDASSYYFAANGATIMFNGSGSNEVIGKQRYRAEHQMVGMSSRCVAGYVYVSTGPGESTTGVVFSGHCGIADNGTLLAETKPLEWVKTFGDAEVLGESIIVADIDLDHIAYDRMRMNSFVRSSASLRRKYPCRKVLFTLERDNKPRGLARSISAHPYVPQSKEALAEVCQKLVSIKLAADITRLTHVGLPDVWIAVSGGLDSTARLLDAVKAVEALGLPRSKVHAVTMPGFGTSGRTYNNVVMLCQALGVTFHEIDIKPLSLALMQSMGYKPFGIDIQGMTVEEFIEAYQEKVKILKDLKDTGFENAQAHVRTLVITRLGFALGTADMSEAIIGWCTWLADQLGGHYNPQQTMPKTLVRFQVQWQADNEFDGEARAALLDILDTPVSPELLPTDAQGNISQKTDDINGPEEVRDFMMRYFRRFGDRQEKIMYLLLQAEGWKREYALAELTAWWQRFITRVMEQRYKSSTRVEGAQVGSDSLDPQGNWMVPSEASPAVWKLPEGFDITPFLKKIEKQVKKAE